MPIPTNKQSRLHARLSFIVGTVGWELKINEYEFPVSATIIFGFAIFWGSPFPRVAVVVNKDDRLGTLQLMTFNKGHHTVWRFQGPIQKIEH